MKEKIKEKIKDKCGGATMNALFTGAFVVLLAFFVFDYMRAFAVQENLTDELYSLANNSIKGSMYTSFYFDQSNYFDEEECETMFYAALIENLNLEKKDNLWYAYDSNGNVNYALKITDLTLNGIDEKARLKLTGEVFVQASFLRNWYEKRGYIYPIYVETKPIQTIGL